METGAGATHVGQFLSLTGVTLAWEACADLRARVRESRRLFISSTKGDYEPACRVDQAVLNVEVLAPLLRCIRSYRAEDGSLPLFTVAQAEREILDYHFFNEFHPSFSYRSRGL